MRLWALVKADLGDSRSTWRALLSLLTVRGAATLMFRLSHAAGQVHPLAGTLIKQLNHLITGGDLAWQAEAGPGLRLYHPTGVVIGPHVLIGRDCSIQSGVALGGYGGSSIDATQVPSIGDRVSIGSGAKVIGGIEVGNDVSIGANAVVLTDVAPGVRAYGVPYRPKRVP
jgi:serine O-acetyltransferase